MNKIKIKRRRRWGRRGPEGSDAKTNRLVITRRKIGGQAELRDQSWVIGQQKIKKVTGKGRFATQDKKARQR